MLSPEVADRLAKLLGMLGSDHAGERAAAGLKATALLKREGLRWLDVIQPSTPAAVGSESERADWRTMAHECAARPGLLSDREFSFVRSMTGWHNPSRKQIDWLISIHARIRGRR